MESMRRSASAAAAMLPPGFLRPMAEPGLWPSVALAVLVHLLLAVFLVFGLRWSTKPPDTVVVELWGAQLPPAIVPAEQAEPAPVAEEPPPPPRPAPPLPPKAAPEPRSEPRPEPRPEPKPALKPDIALKKADERKAEKAVEKKQDRKADKKADKKAERKDDLRFDLDQQMKEQLAREMSAVQRDRPRAEAPSPAATSSAAAPQREGNSARQSAEYQARIRAKIKANIVVPPDISGNPEAVFDVVQLPTGELLGEPRLVKSSGHRGYDEAVLRAILKSQPLPRPERPELFVRELRLNFTPRE
jgi:colicin import membrane protein